MLAASLALVARTLLTCPSCEPAVAARHAFFTESLWPRLAMVALPVAAVTLVLLAVARLARSPALSAGLFLGAGLGGFVDGILFHQILQWHNMLSSVVVPLDVVSTKYNMIWDGIFHAATWIHTFAGVILLARLDARQDARLAGGMLAGFGVFNLIEGLIDHQWLALHHVHPGAGEVAWDVAFLAAGAVLIAFGALLFRAARHRTSSVA